MNKKTAKFSSILDYLIGILSMLILVLGTFLMPQLYSTIVDNKDLDKVHVIDRENFNFENPIDLTVYEQVQQMMEALSEKDSLKRTLYLTGAEMTDEQLLESVREALDIIIQYKMIPDLSAYNIEKNIIYAEYYNLIDSTKESGEKAFWVLRFSDYLTFDFTFRIDANEYFIYQAEIYCAEAADYVMQLTSDDKEVVVFLNNQFMENSASYFEAEGYSALTDVNYADMAVMMGYERGEYAVYHTPCANGYMEGQGIRWGFVPMAVALEDGAATQEWGYKGIALYFKDLYGVNVYDSKQGK